MLQLVAVGYDDGSAVHRRRVDVNGNPPARRHGAEVIGPREQLVLQTEAVEHEARLVVLHLPEVEYLADKLYEYARVALHHLEHRAVLAAHGGVVEQLVGRPGDERQRRAQLVAHVGEELQLRLRHALHVLGHAALALHGVLKLPVDASLGHVGSDGIGAHDDEQRDDGEQDEQVDTLRVELVGSPVDA